METLLRLNEQEMDVLRSVLDFAKKEDPGSTRIIDQIREKAEPSEENVIRDVANKIWKIAGESPEHGNAVMDILGLNVYQKVSEIAKKGCSYIGKTVTKQFYKLSPGDEFIYDDDGYVKLSGTGFKQTYGYYNACNTTDGDLIFIEDEENVDYVYVPGDYGRAFEDELLSMTGIDEEE